MEIALLDSVGFKIKGKKVAILLAPAGVTVENYKISGPGEYEIAGVDVIFLPGGVCRLRVDGVSLGYINRRLTDEEKTRLGTINIVLTPADKELDTDLEAAFVIPLGKPEEIAKFARSLGTENVVPVPKLVTSVEKLPEATTVVVLG